MQRCLPLHNQRCLPLYTHINIHSAVSTALHAYTQRCLPLYTHFTQRCLPPHMHTPGVCKSRLLCNLFAPSLAQPPLPKIGTMAEAVLAHISASKSLLGSMASRPNFAKVSQNERMRLQAMMHTLHGAPTSHIAQVSAEISGAGFAESDLNTLLDVVADLATSTIPAQMSNLGAPACRIGWLW